jgi:hypothetical protein
VFEINKRRLEEVGSDALQDMLDRRDWTDLPVHSAFAANKKAGIITDDDDVDDDRAQSTTLVIEEVVPAKEVSAEEQADLDMEAELVARWEMELEMMSLQATGRSGQRSSQVIEEVLVPEEEEEVGEELDDIDMEAEIQARWEMELEMMALQSGQQSAGVIEEEVEDVVQEEEEGVGEELDDIDMEAEIQARWEMELEMMALQSGQQSAGVTEEEVEDVVQEEEEEVGEELDDIDMEAEIQARWEMELEMMALQSTGGAGQDDVSEVETLNSESESYIAEAEGVEAEGAGGEGEEDYSDLLLDVDKWLQDSS